MVLDSTIVAPEAPPPRAGIDCRIAYVAAAYPAISHTFIQREVRALRALGATVDVFSVHRARQTELLSSADR